MRIDARVHSDAASSSLLRVFGGTWRIAGDEFCWTHARRAAAEECFDVERSGISVRLLRDRYEVFSAALTPIKRPAKERSSQ